jgi:hypothetical protein
MGRGGSDRGRRSGPGRKAPTRPDQRREQRNRNDASDSPPGPSRLLLTKLIREGTIWNVYVATTPHSGGPNRTHLEFEHASAGAVRYVRRAEGPLLDALHSGAPVSRSNLQGELELALAAGGAADPDGTDPAGPDGLLSESR